MKVHEERVYAAVVAVYGENHTRDDYLLIDQAITAADVLATSNAAINNVAWALAHTDGWSNNDDGPTMNALAIEHYKTITTRVLTEVFKEKQ